MGALTHNGEVMQGLPADASQINFDKTGTDLNSTQTENAIKEVNTKVNTNTADITQLKSGLTNVGNYSTSEVNTGMKWTDGRDIFRKVISCGALPDTNQKNENSGLSNVTIIGIHGIAISASDTIPLPHVSSANKNAQLHYSTTLGAVMITTADDYSAYTQSYVTLLYVKNA